MDDEDRAAAHRPGLPLAEIPPGGREERTAASRDRYEYESRVDAVDGSEFLDDRLRMVE